MRLFGLWLFQNQGGSAAFPLVGEHIEDLAGVGLFQGYLIGTLHGTPHRNRSTSIGGFKVQVSRLQAEDFTDSQREDHAQVNRQMQSGVLHGLKGRQHGVLVPDGAFLRGELGCLAGNRGFVDQIPFDRIGKRSLEQRMNFMDRSRSQAAFLLLGSQLLLFALLVQALGGLAQGGVELFQIKGAYILHL